MKIVDYQELHTTGAQMVTPIITIGGHGAVHGAALLATMFSIKLKRENALALHYTQQQWSDT